MKDVKTMAAQGDVLFRKIDRLPEGLVRRKAEGRHIVAHSETGHHHTVDAIGCELFDDPKDPMICYLQLGDGGMCDVVHERNFDTHETLRLLGMPSDVFEIRRQREHTPEGWRMVTD